MNDRLIADRDGLAVLHAREPRRVAITRTGQLTWQGVVLDADELRWLLHTGGPAALAALERADRSSPVEQEETR